MLGVLGKKSVLGYCTNVHAAQSYDALCGALSQHTLAVRDAVWPQASESQPFGVGLWISNATLLEINEKKLLKLFRKFLQKHHLLPFTLNGFPYGDFHSEKVKQDVYLPNWSDKERRDYTYDLAKLLSKLLPDDVSEGSISTVPIGWPDHLERDGKSTKALDKSVERLVRLSEKLAQLEEKTGKCIHIDLEPEPGCYLESARDVVALFARLRDKGDKKLVSRYLRVCHDICHSAVMFEDQIEAISQYAENGIRIGKVQISSALKVDFAQSDTKSLMDSLNAFAEDRYLHQTSVRSSDGQMFFEDLPKAIMSSAPQGEWRIHFHVPLDWEGTGDLKSTQADAAQLLNSRTLVTRFDDVKEMDVPAWQLALADVNHFEVETYAWTVLPDFLQAETLADGIARELNWVKSFGY